jgi:hypothetical protein
MLNRKILSSNFLLIGYAIGPIVYIFLAGLSGLNPGAYDWDELVYLARSKDLSHGLFYQSGDYWADYRAPGLPVLLRLFAVALGYDERTLVLLPIILGLTSILLVGYIAKELAGRTASMVAMGTLPLLPYYVLTNSGFYADTAGCAFSLLTVAIAIFLAKQKIYRVVPFILALVFLGALSTYMRFGAVFTIVPLLMGIILTQYFQQISSDRASFIKKWTTFSMSIGIGTLLVYLNPYITLMGNSPAVANSALTSGREDLSVPIAIREFVKLNAYWFKTRTSLDTAWLLALAILVFTLIAILVISRKNGTLASFRNSYIWFFVFILQLTLLATQVGLMSKNYFLIFTPTLSILFGMLAVELRKLNGTSELPRIRNFFVFILLFSFGLATLVIANRILINKKVSNIDVYRSALIEIQKQSGDTQCNVLSNMHPTVVWVSKCNGMGWDAYGTGWDYTKNPEYSRFQIANSDFLNPSRTWQAKVSGTYFFIVSNDTKRQPPMELLEKVLRLKGSEEVKLIADPNRENNLIIGQFFECSKVSCETNVGSQN